MKIKKINGVGIELLYYILIISISIILSLITCSIQNLINIKNVNLPLIYHIIIWLSISSIFFKIKFKKINKFKFFILRKIVYLNTIFNFIEKNHIFSDTEKISKLQSDSIRLWYSLLKDRDVELNACISSNYRVIKRGNMICYLKNSEDTNLTVVDNSDSNVFYQVFIPQNISKEMQNCFDITQKKIFEDIVTSKQQFLSDIIRSKSKSAL